MHYSNIIFKINICLMSVYGILLEMTLDDINTSTLVCYFKISSIQTHSSQVIGIKYNKTNINVKMFVS